jgi:hypothetical protein
LADLATWPKGPNADLKKGFSVAQVADRQQWPESLVWSIALEGKNDLQRFKALNWGLRIWDLWNWNDGINLFTWQYHRDVCFSFCFRNIFYIPEFAFQHMPVKKQQRIKRLILC